MTSLKKGIGYGLLTWIIPFLSGFALYTPDGIPRYNELLISNIFEIIGGLVGLYLLVKYFKIVKSDYIKEGWAIGMLWFAMNVILDIAILLPLAGMEFGEYVQEIGVGYLLIPIISVGMAYALENKKSK